MQQRDENKIRMFETVWIVIQNFLSLWKSNEGFSEVVDELGDGISAIKAEREPANTSTNGVTTDKVVVQEDLTDSIMEISGPLYTIAKRAGNNELLSQVTFTDSGLAELTEGELAETGTKVATLARANLTEMKRYGIAEADITHLETTAASYSKKIPQPRGAAVTRSSAKKSLSQMVRETNLLLKEQLDGLVDSYRRKSPEFCDTYYKARHTLNLGVRHEKKEDTTETKK
jgi:hypothetical protein